MTIGLAVTFRCQMVTYREVSIAQSVETVNRLPHQRRRRRDVAKQAPDNTCSIYLALSSPHYDPEINHLYNLHLADRLLNSRRAETGSSTE